MALAYFLLVPRDLPRLLSSIEDGGAAQVCVQNINIFWNLVMDHPLTHALPQVNVLLSLDETYADIAPVRSANNTVSAFVSIMRGCNNMCSYCIVPFTRGRERSRPAASVLDEVRQLSQQGTKNRAFFVVYFSCILSVTCQKQASKSVGYWGKT